VGAQGFHGPQHGSGKLQVSLGVYDFGRLIACTRGFLKSRTGFAFLPLCRTDIDLNLLLF